MGRVMIKAMKRDDRLRGRFERSEVYERAVVSFDELVLRGMGYKDLCGIRDRMLEESGVEEEFWIFCIRLNGLMRRLGYEIKVGESLLEIMNYYDYKEAKYIFKTKYRGLREKYRACLKEIGRKEVET